MMGTVISQALPVLVLPFLSRLYLPAEFGELALFVGIVASIALLATGRYEMSIVLPQEDKDAKGLFQLCLNILSGSFGLILVLILLLFAFNDRLPELMKWKNWFMLVPVGIFLVGYVQTGQYLLSRNKAFNIISRIKVTESVVVSVLGLLIGYVSPGTGGLITAYFISLVSSALLTWWWSRSYLQAIPHKPTSKERKQLAYLYKDFPLFNSIHQVFDMVQRNGMVFLISYFCGNALLGQYSQSLRALRAPLAVIGAAVGQVFFQEASSRVAAKQDVRPLFRSVLVKLSAAGILIFVVLFIWAEDIFSIVLGDEWREAGTITKILIPWLFFNFIASPLSNFPLVVNQQRKYVLFSVIGNSLAVLAYVVLSLTGYGFYTAVTGFSIGMIAFTIFCLVWNYSLTGKAVTGREAKA